MKLDVQDLGPIDYDAAMARQKQAHGSLLEREAAPTVFLLEHDPPVITLSRRTDAAGHLRRSQEFLDQAGVQVRPTDRGGDITYHGPGQLVAWPVVPLEPLGLNLRQYVRLLEEAVIETVAGFGVQAGRDVCGVGVWVNGAKLAAIGVRVQRWITMHGLALNVTTNLEHFSWIVPCGLNRPVTSLEKLLGPDCPAMDEVKARLASALSKRLSPDVRPPAS